MVVLQAQGSMCWCCLIGRSNKSHWLISVVHDTVLLVPRPGRIPVVQTWRFGPWVHDLRSAATATPSCTVGMSGVD
jgi:hypothetical protein